MHLALLAEKNQILVIDLTRKNLPYLKKQVKYDNNVVSFFVGMEPTTLYFYVLTGIGLFILT